MKEGWEFRRLGDVANVYDGPHATPSTVDYGPVFLGIGSLKDGVIDLGDTRHVTRDDFALWTRRVRPQAGDIVFSYETRLGQAAIIPEGLECCLGRRMGLIRFKDENALPRYFLYQYLSPQFREFLDTKTIRGATVDRLSIKEFPSFPVAFPPLPEQKRIVALLDEAFAGLATAKGNAERNLRNARAIFKSHLDSFLLRCGEQWEQKELGEVCEFENGDRGENYPNKSARKASGVPFINAGHLTRQGLDMESMDFISRERFNLLGAGKVKPRDVLFCLRGSLGKHASVGDLAEGAIASSLIIVRPGPGLLDTFLLAYLSSSMCSNMIDIFKNGAAQPNLSAHSLRRFVIPVPILEEQDSICKELDAFSTDIQHLTQIYEHKLAALEELKKSLLQQAFNGEL